MNCLTVDKNFILTVGEIDKEINDKIKDFLTIEEINDKIKDFF